MRKLSITLLLIGISFMTMEANNYSTDHKTRIYFKKWNERQKTVIFLPIEATIEENNIEVQFFEKSNEPATFQVKDKNGNIVFQDVVIPDKLEIYKIDLDGFSWFIRVILHRRKYSLCRRVSNRIDNDYKPIYQRNSLSMIQIMLNRKIEQKQNNLLK